MCLYCDRMVQAARNNTNCSAGTQKYHSNVKPILVAIQQLGHLAARYLSYLQSNCYASPVKAFLEDNASGNAATSLDKTMRDIRKSANAVERLWPYTKCGP